MSQKLYIKTGSWLVLFALLGVFLFTCQKKKLDIDIEQTACKNFKILNPSYTKIVDPSCTGTPNGGTLRIACKYEGKTECIKKINIKARFYNSSSSQINNVSYPSELQATDPLVTITGDSIIFKLNYTFADGTDPKSLNFIYVNYYTENEYGDISKKLQLRVNSNCSNIDPGTYKVVDTVRVTSSNVSVTLWDDGKEDGDIVSVWINDIVVLDNYVLTNAGRTFTFQVQPGNNKLVLFAINEGDVGPNTAAITINNSSKINLSPDLLKGEAINIVF